MAKIYNALLCIRIEPKIEKILRKNQNGFLEKLIHNITKFDYLSTSRTFFATILFVDFSKVFDFIHRGKMKQILFTYSLPKEIIAAIMMLYKNTNGDTDYFDIVAGVLPEDTLAPYLFIICLDYVLRMFKDLMKENNFKHKLLWTQTTLMT